MTGDIKPKDFGYDGKGKFKLNGQPTEAQPKLYDGKSDYRKKIEAKAGEIDQLQQVMYAHDRDADA